MPNLRLLALFLAAGCTTPEPDTPEVSMDAGDTEDTGSKPACTPSIEVDRTAISEGSRVEVALEVPDGAVASLVSPRGWRRAELAGAVRLEPPYGSAGTAELTVTATCADGGVGHASAAIEVRPLVFRALPVWTGHDGPSEREHPALLMDPGDPDRVLLYGGFAFEPQQYTVVTDLWGYDLANDAWTLLTETDPPALAGGRWAAVEGARALLYNGGTERSGTAPFDLARLDVEDASGAWSHLTPDGAPNAGVDLGSFVSDPPRGRYLSICGYGEAGISCDVDEYDLGANRWSHLDPVGDVPEGRYGFFVADDRENERVVIFSGGRFSFSGEVNPAPDTWALELGEDPVRWVKLFDDGPPGRRNGCSAVDPIGHRFFVWGGTPDAATTSPGLWVLDLDRGEEEWREVDPQGTAPERSSCTAVYDPARQRILFGFGNTTGAIYADWQALEL